jgi:iron complex outermembrane recepter protein
MQKFILIFITSFSIFSFHLHAQTVPAKPRQVSFSGVVTNAQNDLPLPGASVHFPDLRSGTITNDNGSFIIQNIPSGTYLIEISFTGFTSILQSITLKGDLHTSFSLSPTAIETEAVTVTGVSSATSVRRTPIPVDIVKKEDLMKNASTNLVDALSKTPGVSQISSGPAISKPTIRGLGYNRLVVVNDGVRQEGQQWGDEHGIEIDEYNVTKAEVLKGPASLMYGSDALAGVINIISINPVPQGTIKGNLFANYQTNNQQRGLHANIGGNDNGFIWGAYGSYKAAADYQNKFDGHVFNSKFNERNFGMYTGLNRHWGFTHFYVTNYNQRLGLVEGARDSATGRLMKEINNNGTVEDAFPTTTDFKSTNPFTPSQQINHFKIASENSFNIGKDRLTATIGYQRNQRKEFGDVLMPGTENLFFDLNTVNYNFQYHLSATNGWKNTIGINGMSQSNKNKGEEVLIPEYDMFDVGVFLYSQKRWQALTFSGGLRFDNRHLNSKDFSEGGIQKFDAFTKNFSNVSASAGLSYETSKHVTWKLNLARGFRAPSIPELASNGAHEGTNRYEYGVQNLKSEQSLQVDAGLEIASEHISISGNLFYNHINNFIFYRKLNAIGGGDSILSDGNNQYFAFRFDQQNANLYGAEINVDVHPHPLDWLHIENTFSFVRGILSAEQDGSKNLPFIPAPRLVNEIKIELLKDGKGIKNLYAKTELDNTFAQNNPFTGFDTETNTPGYSLLNAGFGFEIARANKPVVSIYFAANNITDVAYQNHLSRLKYTDVNNVTGRQGVFNMGRNFSLKVNVPLSFK